MKKFKKYHLYFVIYNLLFITILSCENLNKEKQSDQKTDQAINSEENRMIPEGVVFVNSWIEENLQYCYQIMKSESLEKLYEWMDGSLDSFS